MLRHGEGLLFRNGVSRPLFSNVVKHWPLATRDLDTAQYHSPTAGLDRPRLSKKIPIDKFWSANNSTRESPNHVLGHGMLTVIDDYFLK